MTKFQTKNCYNVSEKLTGIGDRWSTADGRQTPEKRYKRSTDSQILLGCVDIARLFLCTEKKMFWSIQFVSVYSGPSLFLCNQAQGRCQSTSESILMQLSSVSFRQGFVSLLRIWQRRLLHSAHHQRLVFRHIYSFSTNRQIGKKWFQIILVLQNQ